MSAWDLPATTSAAPPSSVRAELRAEDSGRYSLALTSPASDPGCERVATCCACDCQSTNDVRGLSGWGVLRGAGGYYRDICRDCRGLS